MPADIDGTELTVGDVREQLLTITKNRAVQLGIEFDQMGYLKIEGRPHTSDQLEASIFSPLCFYVHGDRPGCLVGQFLHANGVTLKELTDQEGRNAEEVVMELIPDVSPEVVDYLARVQTYQDEEETWKHAIETSYREAEEALIRRARQMQNEPYPT